MVKRVKCSLKGTDERDNAYKELKTLISVSHQNVLSVKDIFETPSGEIAYTMPIAWWGDLEYLIKCMNSHKTKLSESKII
jgi:serine/threonine protein kinase